jgi:hypothetical protein
MEMLNILASARSWKEMESLVAQVIEVARSYADALRSGQVPYQDLVITKTHHGRANRDAILVLLAQRSLAEFQRGAQSCQPHARYSFNLHPESLGRPAVRPRDLHL